MTQPETPGVARYEIEILAPSGGGRSTLDTYATGPNYAVDHAAGRILVKLDDGRDGQGRPVLSATYGGDMRAVVRTVADA